VHAHGSEDAERYPGEAGVFSRKLWLLEFERGRVRTRRKVSVSATG
jgi:hypothetical protein